MKSIEQLCRLALALAWLSLLSSPLYAQGIFPDKGLEAAVRKEVFAKRNNSEPITKEDVKRISQIRAAGLKIKDLTGIEHCISVQLIDLSDNEIADLSPMKDLKLLIQLRLANNKLKSIGPLEQHHMLQYLDLNGNEISDLAPLAKMANLRTLYLNGNPIKDISVLENCPKIWSLYIDKTKIENFKPIGKLRWLTTLHAENCGIKELGFLEPLPSPNSLYLSGNKIEDIQPLIKMAANDESRRFASLWRIDLSGNPIANDPNQEQKKLLDELKGFGTRLKMDAK